MDQRQTGGEWTFELEKISQINALTGELGAIVVIELINPASPWRIKVGVLDKKGKYAMSELFRTPYSHRRGKSKSAYGEIHTEVIKNLPREAKRAIRRAFPLAVLML